MQALVAIYHHDARVNEVFIVSYNMHGFNQGM